MIWRKKSFKPLIQGLKNKGGRSSDGKLATYHRGGGSIRVYRRLDYLRSIFNVSASVSRLEYNPVTNSLIAFICFANGVLAYIPAPVGISVGSVIKNDWLVPENSGGVAPLSSFPIGSFIHNLERIPLTGIQYLRSPGTYGRVMSKTFDKVVVSLRSGCLVNLDKNNIAVAGILTGKVFVGKSHNKAGFARLRGRRPVVRGVAMNPVDHPHGGGEGKSGAGRPSVSR